MDEGSNSSTPNGLASVSSLRTERLSTAEEVDQAVGVLLELCRSWGLPATILRPGYAVFGRLAPDELERLARRTCQRVRQFDGTKDKIRNPLGWAIERIKRAEDEWWAAAPGAQAPAAALDPARPLSGEVQGPGRATELTEPVLEGVAAAEMVRRLRDPYRDEEQALVGSAAGES
ncbi:MAG TPA: hypothetical protein VFF24_16535 [Acidimicrobiia bacterium]|nr:hypothetical protein [Acidimicrobiia bacterium]